MLNITAKKINISTPLTSGSFSYSDTSGFTYANGDLYAFDYNNDGVQEVLFSAFETQYNTPENFTNSNVSIFGWKDGELINLTSTLLPGNNKNVEGTGDVAFGDFNGDGLVDVYLSGSADMNYLLHSYELINRGSYYEKIQHELATNEHGVASGDLNKDGFDDVVVASLDGYKYLYFGSPGGLVKSKLTGINGSGTAIADFLNNGTKTIIVTDASSVDQSDTKLFSILYDLDNKAIAWNLISVLPTPRLASANLQKQLYGDSKVQYPGSHAVRAEALDFSGDGLVDVLIFENGSTSGFQGSQIQFLKNMGDGKFEDVTDVALLNYPLKSQVTYNPMLLDVNGDARNDVYIGVDGGNDAFLISNASGVYQDSFRSDISKALINTGVRSAVVLGPDHQLFLVQEDRQYGGLSKVYYSGISFDNLYEGGDELNNIQAGIGNDTITGAGGNDTINGGEGQDTVAYALSATRYTVTAIIGGYQVADQTGAEGTDTLLNVESLKFADQNASIASFVRSSGTPASAKFWKDNTKVLTDTKKNDAVNLTDAIAILKMIVGLNVNSNNTALSLYQAIAADFDQSGDVGLTDAIGVLKMVVGLSAPIPTWKYYDDTKLASSYTSSQSLNPKGWTNTAELSDSVTADSSVKLVGVLTGDVDGSWTGA